MPNYYIVNPPNTDSAISPTIRSPTTDLYPVLRKYVGSTL